MVFAFWDAQAHLDIARRIVDSTTPGLQMLGTVWLPLPHLLMLPFTLVDRWWWNGLAGGIVGLAAYIVIVAALHALLMRRIGTSLAWAGTIFVALNPSLLYLQTTAMTEPVLLAALVLSVSALDLWNHTGSRKILVLAACSAAVAVGSRYDGWFYLLVATPCVAWWAWPSPRAWPTPHPKRWLPDAAIFAAPSALMIAAWLIYNAVYFGDPLAFQRGAWSAQSQAAALAGQQMVPTAHHPLVATAYYLAATALCSGIVLLLAAVPATAIMLRHLRTQGVALLLLTALPFNVLALWAQQSVIQLPWGHPAGLLNVRYGIMMLPGLAAVVTLALARVLRRLPRARKPMLAALVGAILVQACLFAIHWPAWVGALREGIAIRDGDPRQQVASDWLVTHYDGGRLLVDEAVNISPRTRIPLRNRVYRWTWLLGPAALTAPEQNVDWVVVDTRHGNDVVAQAIADRPAFTQRFDRVFDDNGLAIWRRK
ncbi:MAG TPA: hypothetical protein VGM77_10770 [Gemmatimonadales bacterium]